MDNVWTICRKEFRGYFTSPIAYVFITVFLMLSSWLFLKGFFITNHASMRGYFAIMPWLFLFFVPAVTMRLWAEEKKLGTMEILMTLPVRDHEVVLGKFFAAFFFLGVAILLSFTLPWTLFKLGEPDFGPIIGGYLALMLMGAAYLAIGLFVSSLTENQIIAFILGVVLTFFLFIVGESIVLMNVADFLVPLLKFIGLGTHFDSVCRGVIDSRDLIYYLSLILFFLYLNVRSVESRKWR